MKAFKTFSKLNVSSWEKIQSKLLSTGGASLTNSDMGGKKIKCLHHYDHKDHWYQKDQAKTSFCSKKNQATIKGVQHSDHRSPCADQVNTNWLYHFDQKRIKPK